MSVVAVQPDGRIVIGGSFTTVSGAARGHIARLNADGSLDTTFDPGANGAVGVMALQSDGKIVIGGSFTTVGGASRNRIARLNADGSLDITFDPGADAVVQVVALQPDGRIVIGGSFASVGGTPRSRIARVEADGSLDVSFDPGADGAVSSLAIQADGKILVSGAFVKLGGGGAGTTSRNYVGRLDADGTLDTSFEPGADGIVSTVLLQVDGRILVGGRFTKLGGGGTGTISRFGVGRLNADGSLDTTFRDLLPEMAIPSGIDSLALKGDGELLIGDWLGPMNLFYHYTVRRYVTTSAIQSLTLEEAGTSIAWMRDGTGPEVAYVTFENATDGAEYTPLGQAARIAGGWRLPEVSLPAGTRFIRARGYYTVGGGSRGSSSIVESVREVHGPPVLGAPLHDIEVHSPRPTYSWQAVAGAEEYYLWVVNGGLLRAGEWIAAGAAGCSSGTGTCTATPASPLVNGPVRWQVKARSTALGDGAWSADGWFTVSLGELGVPTLVSPTGNTTVATNRPAFTWNALAAADEYYLWVVNGGAVSGGWYTAAVGGCAAGTGTCSVTPGFALVNGPVRWQTKGWNSARGHGPWSADGWFTLSVPPLMAPGLVSPVSNVAVATTLPAYRWNAVAGAEEYYLWVVNGGQLRVGQWVTASAAGCAGGAGTCSLTPSSGLVAGSVRWQVKAWSTAAGHGPWSADGWFTVSFPPLTPPALVSPIDHAMVYTPQPTYSWQAVAGTEQYFLWVSNGGFAQGQWFTAAEANCPAGVGTCSATPPFALQASLTRWEVKAWSTALGHGPWSADGWFTVSALSTSLALQ